MDLSKAWKTSDGRIMFYCRGCDCHHAVNETWTFNGDFDNPTFSPSVLVRGTKMSDKGWADYDKWRLDGSPHRTEPFEFISTVCHSFVRNGKIEYLSDSTHELAGQTVELEDLEQE